MCECNCRGMLTDEQLQELQKLCQPVAAWLEKNATPHDSVVIETYSMRVVSNVAGAPLNSAADSDICF